MKLLETTLWLPKCSGVHDRCRWGWRSGCRGGCQIHWVDTPPDDLFVYQYRDDTWTKTKQISLDREAMFWEADRGLWAVDAKGVVDLWSGNRVVSVGTWLAGLHQTSPKSADIAHDLDSDGNIEWLVHTGAGVSMYENDALVLSSSQPVNGSIRQYTKTGGIQLEVAQRAKPIVFADWNGDGMQELWWLDGDQATVQYSETRTTIDLPVNVDPQYTTRPSRELSWIRYRDVNGDGYTDMVWQYWVRGESWFGSTSEIGLALSDGVSFQTPTTMSVKKAVLDVRLEDLDNDGDLDLWLLGTDLGIATLSKTLLTQQATASLSVHTFDATSFSNRSSATWEVSIPIGQDDAFDYQTIPDSNGDSRVELAVLLAEEARLYASTNDSWSLSAQSTLPSRGMVRANNLSSGLGFPYGVQDVRRFPCYV